MIKIQAQLDDKTRELIGEDADRHEEPIECKAFLMFAFEGNSIQTRVCGPMSVLQVASALANIDNEDLENAVYLAASKIVGGRS